MKKCWMNRFGRLFRQQIRDRQRNLRCIFRILWADGLLSEVSETVTGGNYTFYSLLFLAGCIWYQDNNLKKRLEERNEQLLYAYPGFVHRMILMLGAGMTVRRS